MEYPIKTQILRQLLNQRAVPEVGQAACPIPMSQKRSFRSYLLRQGLWLRPAAGRRGAAS